MPDIKFKENEDNLAMLQEKYNELYLSKYPMILYFTPMQLYLTTQEATPDEWKTFLLDPRFKEWYSTEDEIYTRSKAMELQQRIGDTRSPAEASQMNSLFSKLKELDTKQTSETKIIYTFVPLTEMEKYIPNVRTLDHIPTEIKNAIQVIGKPLIEE